MTQGRFTAITRCRACGNRRIESVLSLGEQTLTGVFPRSEADQRALTRGPLELVKCLEDHDGGCGLLQLRHSFDASELYGDTYGYRSSLNRSMVEHLQGRVRRNLEKIALRPGDVVLDIGSNDGTLLGAYPGSGPVLVGMDPIGEKFRRHYPPHVRLVPEFFSAAAFRAASGGAPARIVTAMAMFYDLEEPLAFVREIASILAPDGIWVFEQSYLPAMLDAVSYDTVCHEHLEYYALSQIKWLLDRGGLRILDVELNDVNGGSICVTACLQQAPYAGNAALVERLLAQERAANLASLEPYACFAAATRRHREALLQLLGEIRARGETMLGYGASTKGNVILQYCGLTREQLPCIAEVNEDKFGAFTPGTGIPIVSEQAAKAMRPDYFLVLPWHFRANILEREQAYRRGGGRLVFPLPAIEVVGA